MAKIRAYVDEVEMTKGDGPVIVRLPNDDAVEVWPTGRVAYYGDKGATLFSNLQMGPRKGRRVG